MKKICVIFGVILALSLSVLLGSCKKQENQPTLQTTSQITTGATTEQASSATSQAEKLPEPVAEIYNLEGPFGTADVMGEDGEYAAHLVFKADQDINNFRFYKVDMTYNEYYNRLAGKLVKEYGAREKLSANEEIVLLGETGETLPFLAVSFESLNGNVYYYAIEISGEDGHAFLTPFDVAD